MFDFIRVGHFASGRLQTLLPDDVKIGSGYPVDAHTQNFAGWLTTQPAERTKPFQGMVRHTWKLKNRMNTRPQVVLDPGTNGTEVGAPTSTKVSPTQPNSAPATTTTSTATAQAIFGNPRPTSSQQSPTEASLPNETVATKAAVTASSARASPKRLGRPPASAIAEKKKKAEEAQTKKPRKPRRTMKTETAWEIITE